MIAKLGGLVLKLPAQWYSGIPDRLVLLPGASVYFVELKKKPGMKAKNHQARWIKLLRELGFNAGVIAGPWALEKFLNKVSDELVE